MKGGGRSGLGERLRLWLAAVLIDLGNWLSLDPAERRARRVWRRLEGNLARLFGRRVALGLMGASFVAHPVAEVDEAGEGVARGAAYHLAMVVARRSSGPAGGRVELRCLVRCPAKGRGAQRLRGGGGGEDEVALWEVTRTPPAPAGTDPSAPRGGVVSHFSRDHESALLNYYFDGFASPEPGPPSAEDETPAAWAAVPGWAPGNTQDRANANRDERSKNVIRELETKEDRRHDDGVGREEYATEEAGGYAGPTAQELLLAEQFAAEIAAEAATAREGFAHDPVAELGLAGAYADEEDMWPGEAVFFGEAISSLADETAEEEIEEIIA